MGACALRLCKCVYMWVCVTYIVQRRLICSRTRLQMCEFDCKYLPCVCRRLTDWLSYSICVEMTVQQQTETKQEKNKLCLNLKEVNFVSMQGNYTHTLSIGNTVYPHLALHSHHEVRVLRWITTMSVCVCVAACMRLCVKSFFISLI